ncbi:HDOD domain-containing protein [Aliidiomarina sp. Khilg15.8]
MGDTTDLFKQVTAQIEDDSLQLPGMPDIAVRVQKAIADPMMTLPRLSQVIAQDPALSARLIRIANSAWLGRPVKAESLPQAVMRLGFWQIRSVALGMALEGLFHSQNAWIKDDLQQNWRQSLELTAAAVTLLNQYRGDKMLHTHTLALGCMCSRIGVLPILSMAEQQPDAFADIEFVRRAKAELAVPLGVKLLQEWNFNDETIRLQQTWRQGVGSFKPDYLSFMQLAAVLLGQIKVREPEEVVKMYAEAGCISRPTLWQQPAVQADYQSILSALSD